MVAPVVSNSTPGQVDTNYAITGTQNAHNPYGIFPMVLGRHRMHPPKTVRGFTEVVDGEIYFRGRYAFGWGPVSLEDLRIGSTPITEFEEVEIEFLNVDETLTRSAMPDLAPLVTAWRSGDELMQLYPDDVAEDTESVELLHDVAVSRFTRERCSSVSLDVTFPQGLASIGGATSLGKRRVDFSFNYRRVGTLDWTYAGDLVCEAAERTLVRFSKEISLPDVGEYEVEVRRLTANADRNDVVETSYLSAVRSFRTGNLPSHPNISEVALRIRASEQLNGQIDSLNGIVHQLAPVWDGEEWSAPQKVRHPAWIYARALMGPHLRRPVASRRIALQALKHWADTEPHWTCDYVVDTAQRVSDMLDIICSAGRARRALTDFRYSIIRDFADAPIRQVFTPRNSWGFSSRIAFPREIHGFRVKVRSERLDWEFDEVTVYADGYNATTATEFETLELPAVVVTKDDTDQGNAWKLGRYYQAVAEHRPEVFKFYADWEHIKVTRGDTVQIVHDVPKIGVGAARISRVVEGSGLVQSIELDDDFDLPADAYRLTIRTQSDDFLIVTSEIEGRNWDLSQQGFVAGSLAVGDLVAIQVMTERTEELIITGIEPDNSEAALITAVPASPVVLEADQGEIPPYDPVITEGFNRYGPPLAIVYQVVTGSAVARVGRSGELLPRIGVDIIQRGYTSKVQVRLRWRRADSPNWQLGEPQLATQTVLTGDLVDGADYAVEVQTLDEKGQTRGFVSAGTLQARARDFDYIVPTGFAAFEGMDSITLAGDEYPLPDFQKFRFYGASKESDETTVIGHSRDPHFTYRGDLERFKVAAVDNSGYESPLTDWIFARPRGITPDDFSDDIEHFVTETAVAAVADIESSMTYALEKLAQVDLENRVSGFLEAARIEGEVTEKTEALSSEVDGVRAELVQNYVTAATQDAALAALQTTLSAQINGVSASLSTSYYTIAQVNSAISAARTSLRSEIAGVSATLNADYYTISETNSAISAATTSVTSTLDSLTTTVNQVQSSVDGVKGTYGVQVNNNGVVTGFGLISELLNGSVSTTFTVQADRFVVASSSGGGALSPFLISGGKVYIRDAVIRNASISSAKIKALAVDTLHIKGKAVDTRQIAENAATTFYEATGGTGYKRIQIRNTHDEPITLIIQVLYDCQDDGGSAALFAGVKIYKEQTAGGKNNLLSSVGDGSTGGGEVAAADGTEVVTTTINPGITRYISAYPEGRVVRRCDMIILQRQR
ncbi:TipJ family phage tail tip protein [Phaeobacter gallaeciensis]|uniref:TipJ family phage tail tip protein n=1 Tax=Phaeobacter gallaeciensis TaxID=60890 RepID=UPI00136494E6|nr:DUF1983 domain-containing protein [Phaeobacter gallaeciensis]